VCVCVCVCVCIHTGGEGVVALLETQIDTPGRQTYGYEQALVCLSNQHILDVGRNTLFYLG